ncbi:MAG: hypothetical protein DHS20C05_16820 [Hyphococcus sp.]|nr:MAG: hypothetical protein DHS20C05_16820 [Marinicaulis sp.]
MTALRRPKLFLKLNLQVIGACIFALFICGGAFSSTAFAQDPTYLAEYKLYSAALQDGDDTATARHARNAWQAAEQELGDHQTTGVLAFNYGQFALFTNTRDAGEALRRANQLRTLGISELPAATLQMMIAFVDFDLGGMKRKHADALRQALQTYETQNGEPSAYSAIIWGRLAGADLADRKYDLAKASAARAEAAIRAAMPHNYQRKAEAIMIGAIATIVPSSRTGASIRNAYLDFVRARVLFPPQKDIDSFAPLLAQILAWEGAARAAVESQIFNSRLGRTSGKGESTPLEFRLLPKPNFTFTSGKSERECGIELIQVEAEFPDNAVGRNMIGAALIGFHLDKNGKVTDARVMADVPTGVYGGVSLEAVKQWRTKSPPPNEPACLQNHMALLSFVVHIL